MGGRHLAQPGPGDGVRRDLEEAGKQMASTMPSAPQAKLDRIMAWIAGCSARAAAVRVMSAAHFLAHREEELISTTCWRNTEDTEGVVKIDAWAARLPESPGWNGLTTRLTQ